MFKFFCCCTAAVCDLLDGKSKDKITVVFFPNSHGYDHLSRIPESREPDFGDQE